MTNAETNEAIAIKVCGWEVILKRPPGRPATLVKKKYGVISHLSLFSPTTSLDDCAIAEKCIEEKGLKEAYEQAILGLMVIWHEHGGSRRTVRVMRGELAELITAPTSVRCPALLKTVREASAD